MYWRKANAIHKWFVDNVQEGNDDCGTHSVSRKQLQDLLNAINAVLEDNRLAEELLPPEDGFFFGSTELDEDYFNDLKDTKAGIEELLKDEKAYDFNYHASW